MTQTAKILEGQVDGDLGDLTVHRTGDSVFDWSSDLCLHPKYEVKVAPRVTAGRRSGVPSVF